MVAEPFNMLWPVIDTRLTRNDLMQQAIDDLRTEYDLLDVRPVSAPAFRFAHGSVRDECRKMGITPPKDLPFDDGPMLVATVAVVTRPRPLEDDE